VDIRRRAAEFVDDLANLVENRPPRALEAKLDHDDGIVERFDFSRADYRILIALREDYLAHLEGLKGRMPSITQNRMRLARMTGEQALTAVLKPGGRLVSEEVAEAIVRFVAGGAELRNAEVEPSLLSLVCRELNNARVAQKRAEISADLLAGSRDTILHEFYERSLADQPGGVRKFIEDEMLTESGFRESLAEERAIKAFAAAGAAPGALALLVNRRLLRIEERLDMRRVELTHDVLCAVVKESRDMRHEREAKELAERELQAQRDREAATHRALVRARKIAAGCAVLAIGAIASALFGFVNMRRAEEAKEAALHTRQAAESARGEAEKLIVYLLDDFYVELEPVGRLDIVADLSRRALDYYSGLPAELRTPQTDRNRALALVRLGHVMRYQSKLEDASKALTEATAILTKLRENGDRSEATSIGLALGLTSLARVNDFQSRGPESEKFALEAEKVIAPLMASPDASTRVRMAYGQVMVYLGFNQLRNSHEEESVKSLEKAREAYRSVDNLQLGNLPSAVGFAEATGWQVEALAAVGRPDEALKTGPEALEVARKVLDWRPNHMPALRAHALISSSLSTIEAESLRMAKAVRLGDSSIADWEAFLKLDPGNAIAWNNLAANNAGIGFGLDVLGKSDAAIERFRRVIEISRRFPDLKPNFIFAAGRLAQLDAEFGRPATATGEYHAWADEIAARQPGTFIAHGMKAISRSFDRSIALTWGRNDEGRDMAEADYRTLEAVKASSLGQERRRERGLAAVAYDAAFAQACLKDYASSEAWSRRAVAHMEKTMPRQVGEVVTYHQMHALLAYAVARQGRQDEAARVLDPDLKYLRDLAARGADDLSIHFALAQALYFGAVAAPANARAMLSDAAARIDAMPPDMTKRKTTVQLRGWIADELAKR